MSFHEFYEQVVLLSFFQSCFLINVETDYFRVFAVFALKKKASVNFSHLCDRRKCQLLTKKKKLKKKTPVILGRNHKITQDHKKEITIIRWHLILEQQKVFGKLSICTVNITYQLKKKTWAYQKIILAIRNDVCMRASICSWKHAIFKSLFLYADCQGYVMPPVIYYFSAYCSFIRSLLT